MAIPITVLSWIRIVPTLESSTVRISTTPFQMSRPARVTTNDGTPAFVMMRAWSEADHRRDEEGDEDHEPPRPARVVRAQEQRHHDAADAR